MMSRYDVIVVGGGNAALCAALAAAEQGARVALLERASEEKRGGNSKFTGGGFRMVHHGARDIKRVVPDLSEADIARTDFGQYTAEDYLDDLGRITQYYIDPDLAETLVKNSTDTVHWLMGRGVKLMVDTPKEIGKMVLARFSGNGTKKILLIAHMDTVYQRGMLERQPFRVDGNRAYGLGIADDKNGIAVILHTLSILQAMNFRDYGLITVLINADEEVSSAGSRAMLTKLGAEHDVVLSWEGTLVSSDRLSLTTAGIGAVLLKITGQASHAGQAPELGRNALLELAHQMLQTRDLSDPAIGLKMNWTLGTGGTGRNIIPSVASAVADVRVLRVADYDGIERKVRERIKSQLIPDTKVEMTFERRRPPLEMTAASQSLGKHAQRIYAEIGLTLVIGEVAEGGGTDAAFAALNTKAPVLERLGLRGFGEHSNEAEYIEIDSIEPRLYLLTRMIMDVSQGKHQ